ncbi:MAG: hypothetical protein HUU45_13095 [Leptospiraceae bacterium]|nr:hypothetical protein [Leptospiraceae bacterium]
MPDGSYGFIDFHYTGKINKLEEPPSVTFAKYNLENDNHGLQFFHLSHYHSDHVKGVEKYIAWIQETNAAINKVWLPGSLPPKSILEKFKNILKSSSVAEFLRQNEHLTDKYHKLESNYSSEIFSKFSEFINSRSKNLKPGERSEDYISIKPLANAINEPLLVKACCLAPNSAQCMRFLSQEDEKILLYLLGERESLNIQDNDISAILLLVAEENSRHVRLLFGGDAEKQNILDCMKYLSDNPEICNGFSFEADFVKVFHHGSKRSSCNEIWDTILPDNSEDVIVAVSAGRHKRFKHPNKKTLKQIKASAKQKNTEVKIFSTNGKGQSKAQPGMSQSDMTVFWPASALPGKKRSRSVDAHVNLVKPDKGSSDDLVGFCFEYNFNDSVIKAKKHYMYLPEKGEVEIKDGKVKLNVLQQ